MPSGSDPLDFKINRAVKRCVDIFFSIIFIAGILSWLVPILAKTPSKSIGYLRHLKIKAQAIHKTKICSTQTGTQKK